MTNCLFLFTLCLLLLPSIAFSSTFISQNPIDLATATNKLVLDTNDNALDPLTSYHIVSIGLGAAGGDVYLGPSPNSAAPCPNGVFRYNYDVGRPIGTPFRFIIKSGYSTKSGIFENQDVNVQFDIATSRLRVIYVNWKIGDYHVSLGARLLETGGTLREGDSSLFKIVIVSELGYNLLYCPGPFVCQ
ncbi:hypothetical protein R3W88_019510 [Solanum pinnatisectum]|uniref:Uncharacterized protein n=1 Tax=Solanum pinnatisectum TaxID=50273 RepID=A0AAV9KJF4_9SOLN|nr:hypothetical protein R3W88_019510 [Solanum pinnatisectum]